LEQGREAQIQGLSRAKLKDFTEKLLDFTQVKYLIIWLNN